MRWEKTSEAVVTSLSSGSSLQSSFSLPVPNLSQFPWQMSCTTSVIGLQRETNDNSNEKVLVSCHNQQGLSNMIGPANQTNYRNIKNDLRQFIHHMSIMLWFICFYFMLLFVDIAVADYWLIWVSPQGVTLKWWETPVHLECKTREVKPWLQTMSKHGCHEHNNVNLVAYCIEKVVAKQPTFRYLMYCSSFPGDLCYHQI